MDKWNVCCGEVIQSWTRVDKTQPMGQTLMLSALLNKVVLGHPWAYLFIGYP